MPNLVGIGLSQVPTNSMLGGMAYQDPEHASIKDLDLKNLSQINSEIVDTAVDVFVYDTSKDSDGGAWRKRTQNTSWHNETLGTATRGSRKDFPAVAVIVAESTTLTIYDGDDPDLPMWMVFTSGDAASYTGPHLNIAGGSTLSAVAALNGEIAVSCNGGSFPFGSVQINFLKDRSLIRPDVGGKESITGIAKRNETGSYTTTYPYTALVNKFANDVAMTVLPNAPIDDATGLPVPTIAVATNGGVSVIKDDGTVVDGFTSTTVQTGFVGIDGKSNKILYAADNSSEYKWIYQFDIPSTDNTGNSYLIDPNSIITDYNHNADFASYSAIPLDSHNDGQVDAVSFEPNKISVGTDNRLALVHFDDDGVYNSRKGLLCLIASSYNTGWQTWNIKGAFLSDTDTTNATGSELVTNGTFNSNINGWTDNSDSGGSISWNSSGYLNVVYSSGNARTTQDITVVVGKQYVITFDVIAETGSVNGFFYAGSTTQGTDYAQQALVVGDPYSFTVTATTTLLSVSFRGFTAAGTLSIDNVSVRLAEEDRSVNNKGLQVFGTVTKSAVATGAELVAYSGWSASNYLEQPYNSDLNFGTGDFYFGGWFKNAGYSDSIIGRLHDSSSAGKGFLLSVSSSGGGGLLVFAIYTLGFQSSGRTTILTTTNETGKGWQQVWGIRRGGTMELWLNGNLVTTGSNTADISDTTYNPPLFIGVQHGSAAFDGELALMRTGASAPSAEQIKKIYEDEKFLFQENAKATLYGSSDAVTALAYDDTTNLLHVGTSAGRSEFQGLRRINNTTTAVTTAISASDELIAEQ